MRQTKWKSLGILVFGVVLGGLFSRPALFAPASAQAAIAGAGGETVAFVNESASGGQFLYLIDPKQKVLSVYEFDPRKTKLKLAAVRHFSADHQLAEFNNEPPMVADIERLVRPR